MVRPLRMHTPESVDVSFEPVGVGSRFLASLLDALIQAGVALVLLLAAVPAGAMLSDKIGFVPLFTGLVGGLMGAFLLLLFALLFLGYKPFYELIWNGQTPGKRWVGIRVVSRSGMPVRFHQVLIRNLLRPVDMLPIYYGVGLICVLVSGHRQRLGDMAADTVVVRDLQRVQAPQVPRQLSHPAEYDLNRLRELVLRLPEPDLAPARAFWERRRDLEEPYRQQVGRQVAEGLARRLGWSEPVTEPEWFVEEVLYVRAL